MPLDEMLKIATFMSILKANEAVVYLRPPMMDPFAKVFHAQNLLTVFTKNY